MSRPSLFHNLKPCLDPRKANSEQENPRIDRWSGSLSVHSVSNWCNLDMCTETLGFENGAMLFDYELEIGAETKKGMPEKQRGSAAMEFPPPLTTLRGEGRMILRRRSEEGRVLLIGFRPLVIEAERSGGRLVLRIPARGDLEEKGEEGEEEEDENEDEEGEEEAEGEKGVKEELVLSYGCGGKCRSASALFSSDAFLLAAT